MTLIAHGILALNKVIQQQKLENRKKREDLAHENVGKSKEEHWSEVYGIDDTFDADEKIKSLNEKIAETKKQLRADGISATKADKLRETLLELQDKLRNVKAHNKVLEKYKTIRYKKEETINKLKEADKRLKKLKNIEHELNTFAAIPRTAVRDLFRKDYIDPVATPTALENAILAVPFVGITFIATLVLETAEMITKPISDKIADKQKAKEEKAEREAREEVRVQERKKEEQKQIENKAALIRFEKEQAAIDNAEETVEDEEIKAIEQIIAESRIVDFHTTDTTKDKNAIVKGLTNEKGKVIEIDDDHIVFLYNFSNQPGSITKGNYEASVFFINPETGNYEQIAKFKSKRGMERLKRAVNKKLDKMGGHSLRHEQVQQIQAQMLRSNGRK